MSIPFEPHVFGVQIPVHLVLEYLAFFVGFRYYVGLRRATIDPISSENRLSIILGAIIGALVGSRLMGYLENPVAITNAAGLVHVLNAKSIMGGLFGGLISVEVSKIIIHEKQSSGDLFVFPLIVGIAIGRVGCFLSGTNEFTYGKETAWITGMDLGDGVLRHPIALYEIFFLAILFLSLKKAASCTNGSNGLLFKVFMLSYFGFRFLIEFIKPNVFFALGLSSIQWLCVICWVYYLPTLRKIFHGKTKNTQA